MGGSVAIVLRKMGLTINELEMNIKGQRRGDHPTGFEKIIFEIILSSPDATIEDLNKVIKMSDERLCPVTSMIRGNVEVAFIGKVLK